MEGLADRKVSGTVPRDRWRHGAGSASGSTVSLNILKMLKYLQSNSPEQVKAFNKYPQITPYDRKGSILFPDSLFIILTQQTEHQQQLSINWISGEAISR